jgi:hypothetical protein
VIPSFAEAFLDLDWGPLSVVAEAPETVGIALVPPVTVLVTWPFPRLAEPRIVPSDFLALVFQEIQMRLPSELPVGVSRRLVGVPGAPLSVMTLRRSLDPGIAIDQMISSGFLTEEASLILMESIRARENIVFAGPSSSAKTSLLYACLGEVPPDWRVVAVEEPEPKAHTLLPLPPNIERANPLARLGLARIIREELRSPRVPDLISLGELNSWPISLAIAAAIEERWAWTATVRARDVSGVVGRLVAMVESDDLRKRQVRAEIEVEVVRSMDLIAIMDHRRDWTWLARIFRPLSPEDFESLYRAPRPRL